MAEIKMTKVLPISIDTPDLGRATLFFDSDSNSLALKDDNGDLLAIGGGGFGSTTLAENVDILGSNTPGESKVTWGYDNTNLVGPWWNDANISGLASFAVMVDYRNYTGSPPDVTGGTFMGSFFPVGVGLFEGYRGFMHTDPGGCTLQGIEDVGGFYQNSVGSFTSGGVNLEHNTPTGSVSLYLSADFGCTFNDFRLIPKGIEYGDNYHFNYTNRSLVDKEYVDNGVKKVVATTADTTTDFGNVNAGDFVVHIPATPGNAEFGIAPSAGTSPFTAVVGDLYITFRP
jgi:hypothetical protein